MDRANAVTVARLPAELPPITLPEHEIIEGTPNARCAFIAESGDRGACAGFWSVDVGRYEFVFDYDEFLYVITGAVTITDRATGASHTLGPGDTAHFPQGVTSSWHVTSRLTKYFVARAPY